MSGPILDMATLRAYDPEANLKAAQARACCPLCGDSHPKDAEHRSLSLNTATGLYNCKRCSAKGKLKDYWQPREQSASTFARNSNRPARRVIATAPPPKAQPTEPDPNSKARFIKHYQQCRPLEGTKGAGYLEGRGIPADLAIAAGVLFAPMWKGSGSAVVFPVTGETGEPVAANVRFIKYREGHRSKDSAGPLSTGAFMTPGALDADPVAIVEAPIDALSLAAAGLPSIAICGTWGIPEWAVSRLSKAVRPGFSRTIYTATDADTAGDEAAVKLFDLFPLCTVKRLRPDGAKDWNELLTSHGMDALSEQISRAGIPTTDSTADALLLARNEATRPTQPTDGPPSEFGRAHYEAYGWSRLYSNHLQAVVIIRRDDTIHTPSDVPVWTREQVNATAGMTAEQVQFIAQTMATFGGEIITEPEAEVFQ